MDSDQAITLPEGVTIHYAPDGSCELRVAAPDRNELLWRVHDVVLMIQNGDLEDYLDALRSGEASSSPPGS